MSVSGGADAGTPRTITCTNWAFSSSRPTEPGDSRRQNVAVAFTPQTEGYILHSESEYE